jgi:hypothetical protein
MSSISRIQKQVDFMESHNEIDVVGTGLCYLSKNDIPIGHYSPPLKHEQICRQPDRQFGIPHGTILGKKEWFQTNVYDESLPICIDFNLFFRSYKNSEFANIPEPLYYYRLDKSFSLKKQWLSRKSNARFLFQHYRNKGAFDRATKNYLVQYGKFAATVLMFCSGFREKLMARRYDTINPDEIELYKHELNKIKNYKASTH